VKVLAYPSRSRLLNDPISRLACFYLPPLFAPPLLGHFLISVRRDKSLDCQATSGFPLRILDRPLAAYSTHGTQGGDSFRVRSLRDASPGPHQDAKPPSSFTIQRLRPLLSIPTQVPQPFTITASWTSFLLFPQTASPTQEGRNCPPLFFSICSQGLFFNLSPPDLDSFIRVPSFSSFLIY